MPKPKNKHYFAAQAHFDNVLHITETLDNALDHLPYEDDEEECAFLLDELQAAAGRFKSSTQKYFQTRDEQPSDG